MKAPAVDPVEDAQMRDTQVELERWALGLTFERYAADSERKRATGRAGEIPSCQAMIDEAMPRVALGIQRWIDEGTGFAVGRHDTGSAAIKALGPERCAYLGLWAAFTNLWVRGCAIKVLLRDLGEDMRLELLLSDVADRDPRLFKRVFDRALREHTKKGMRVKSVLTIARREGLVDAEAFKWGEVHTRKVAAPVLDQVLQHAGIFQLSAENDRDARVIELTPEAQERMGVLDEAAALRAAQLIPLVVPPVPWGRTMGGVAYLTPEMAARTCLVRSPTTGQRRQVRAALKSDALSTVIGALNAMGETAFRINRPVLDMVRWATEQRLVIKKFPRDEQAPMPTFPENYDDLPLEDKKYWRIKRRELVTLNRSIRGNVMRAGVDLLVAERFADFERIYLPASMDFRGRVYPLPSLHYQRGDHIRALFEFADGVPLGEQGLRELAIAVASLGDWGKISKQPYALREAWTHENEEMILSVARDPRGDLRWTEADKPFQFLAACLEWAAAGRDPSYPSHLPIGKDGTNSGMQHYSAICRARPEATLVNLVPGERPADIYQVVAEHVAAVIESEAQDGLKEAVAWRDFGITRKTVKRCVMTYMYGSNESGFRNHLMEDLMRPLNEEVLRGQLDANPLEIAGDGGLFCAQYLAGKTLHGIRVVAPLVEKTMRWFRVVARTLAKENHSIQWVVPSGLPVENQYFSQEDYLLPVWLYNKRLNPLDMGAQDRVDDEGAVHARTRMHLRLDAAPQRLLGSKQANTISPNLIHSMDAAHLALTVARARAEGISAFLMIHDDFATHAANIGRLGEILREEFVKMYEGYDPRTVIYSYAQSKLSENGLKKLPPPPELGDLDIRQVLDSPYFFG